MAVVKTWAGGTYNLPLNREPKGTWGTDVSNFLIALANNAVSLTGGTQTLAAELNLGATFGLVIPYVKSASANIAAAGMIRLANTDVIGWRNGANNADLALDINTDRLRFGGVIVPTVASTDTLTNKSISGSANTLTNIPNSATTAASANTSSAIVARDGSGNFSAGTITASLAGNATSANTATTATSATTAGNVTGTVAIANGGTGQTAKAAAFDALSPNTTKGDITARDTSTNVRVAVGSDGTVLTADSASTGGVKWTTPLTNPMTAVGDVIVGGASGAATRTSTTLLGDVTAKSGSATVTITIASPGVVTWTGHGLATGDKIYLTTTGALPTGLTASTTYYVIVVDVNSFKLATTPGNARAATAINTSGTQTGTHTAFSGGLTLTPGQIRGRTDGVAIAAEYLGEEQTASNFGIGLTAGAIATGTNKQLQPGVWRITAFGVLSGAASQTAFLVGISTDSTATTFSDIASSGSPAGANYVQGAASSAFDATYQVSKTVNISAATTYYLKLRALGAGGSAGCYLHAVRIA